jgi:predicted transcriptional regulator of viral defense system
MGREKYLKKIKELFKISHVVDFSSIQRIIRKKPYAKQLIKNLIKKGEIKKIAKGFYTARDDPSVAVFCFKPAYLGLQDALSFHDLWEQETIPVILTSRKVRQGIRKIMGTNVLIRRLDAKYLFGYDYYRQGDIYLPYSDIEKTLIDMVYFKEKLDEEVIRNIKINMKKLDLYLKRYPKSSKNSIRTKIVA